MTDIKWPILTDGQADKRGEQKLKTGNKEIGNDAFCKPRNFLKKYNVFLKFQRHVFET